MDELRAFAGREVIRLLRDQNSDLSFAFSRLRDALTGDPLAACVRLQSEFESTAKPTGDLERDNLRMVVRSVQLVREHDGEFTPQLWTELDRRQLSGLELSASLVQSLMNTLLAAAATAAVALVVVVLYGVFVMPQFQSLYAAMGATLPQLTAALLGGGRWLVVATALLLLVAAAVLVFPVRPGGRRTWRLDLFSKRALFGREAARTYRQFLFVSYASALVAAGIHPRKSLSVASNEAGIYAGIDFGTADAASVTEWLPAQLLSADRLGHLHEELIAQRGLRADALIESIERLQLQAGFAMRAMLYVLVATMVIAMYLPIFKLGSII